MSPAIFNGKEAIKLWYISVVKYGQTEQKAIYIFSQKFVSRLKPVFINSRTEYKY